MKTQQEIKIWESPHARGTHDIHPKPVAVLRFIPARPGNTPNSRKAPSLMAVHPRTPGEHLCTPIYTKGFHRFIPARAGNTYFDEFPSLAGSVHPRTRGEHVVRLGHADGPARFIPARAGNTYSHIMLISLRSVHPRTRGEHALMVVGAGILVGSSPHARGTLLLELFEIRALFWWTLFYQKFTPFFSLFFWGVSRLEPHRLDGHAGHHSDRFHACQRIGSRL